ncbi:MAG: TetR/AcrR family transcriptional regulator [Lachnospiraceae bacterium]|nr:TetR/AcrR family transcriptional regulator [Lachnospiraceae bacterium]
MSDHYHHGNLRQALIDAGIKIINESGEAGLSLRKVASACEVSHAAPYAHFRDKEALIGAMKASVTDRFMEELNDATKDQPDTECALVAMGRRYVSFFIRHPDYFRFLFSSQNLIAHLQTDRQYPDDYPPFTLLKETYLKYLKEKKIKKSKKEQEIEILQLWASAHGLASIACMSGVSVSFDWETEIEGEVLLR